MDLYGEIGIQKFSRIARQKEKVSDARTVFTQCIRCHSPGVKRFHQESSSRGEKTIHILLAFFFNFRENDYNSAINTHFWAWSNFNIFANFDPFMANDSALKSS